MLPGCTETVAPAIAAWGARLARSLDESYQFQNTRVFLFDAGVDALRVVGQCRLGEEGGDLGDRVQPLDDSICGRVYRTGQPALVVDLTLDPDYRQCSAERMRSVIAVPIVVRDRTVGVLNIESPRPAGLGITDLECVTLRAAEAATELDRLRDTAGSLVVAPDHEAGPLAVPSR
ncbi:MAG TPA: GAF domain-containing protein [Candidatus Limnocylindrales bacterium]